MNELVNNSKERATGKAEGTLEVEEGGAKRRSFTWNIRERDLFLFTSKTLGMDRERDVDRLPNSLLTRSPWNWAS